MTKRTESTHGRAPAAIIAEIGCNHKGDFEIARELITTAQVFCKAKVVKFQKRNPRELLSPKEYDSPHPNPMHAYGKTYGEHREFLEFSLDQHRRLKELCDSLGMVYSSSVWDVTSAKEIASLKPQLIKIPSACNTNFDILGYLCDDYGGEIHVSLGMTTRAEEEEIVSFLKKRRRFKDTVLYACTSGYPVPDDSVCLLEITRLREAYAQDAKAIGFSGHHLGIALDVAAFTLGADWIERHYTLDRTWKGTDHAASLEPDGLRRLVRDVASVASALTYKPTELLEIEKPTRLKLKKASGAKPASR
jgi:sialic acid synthase